MSQTEIIIYYALPFAFGVLVIFLAIAVYFKEILITRALSTLAYVAVCMLAIALMLETIKYFW